MYRFPIRPLQIRWRVCHLVTVNLTSFTIIINEYSKIYKCITCCCRRTQSMPSKVRRPFQKWQMAYVSQPKETVVNEASMNISTCNSLLRIQALTITGNNTVFNCTKLFLYKLFVTRWNISSCISKFLSKLVHLLQNLCCLLHRQLPSKGESYLSWNLISEVIWHDQHCQ